jgi:2-isopropylmalate synthase
VSSNPRRVLVFDTTLRDGEQAPGCTMSLAEKVAVAEQLVRLGVDIIEAGFPAASRGEHDAVVAVAEQVARADGAPIVCGLARATAADIESCALALDAAPRRRIHTFIATSDLHLARKLRMTRSEVLAQVRDAVTYARTLVDDVEFSPEDASRSDRDFLCEVLGVAMASGATTVNIPDTVGYATPDEYGDLIRRVCALAAERSVTVSTHCHDDLGLAVANSLAGVRAGARQVECTINGIGERAGNAALEEIVMALRTRAEYYETHTAVDTREIVRTSRLVAACTRAQVPANKAIVGANAFAHEAGIHQDGVLKDRQTYEIMSAQSVGHDGSSLVLGKHCGRSAVRRRLEELGVNVDEALFADIFDRLKALADRQKLVTDRDLIALAAAVAQPAFGEPTEVS